MYVFINGLKRRHIMTGCVSLDLKTMHHGLERGEMYCNLLVLKGCSGIDKRQGCTISYI